MGIIGEMYCGVWVGRLPKARCRSIFWSIRGSTAGMASMGVVNVGFMDNDNRYVFLSRAALELPKFLCWQPDILHAMTGIPLPCRSSSIQLPQRSVGGQCRLNLTIHNMQYQGNFYPGLMEVLDIGWEYFTFLGWKKDDQVTC